MMSRTYWTTIRPSKTKFVRGCLVRSRHYKSETGDYWEEVILEVPAQSEQLPRHAGLSLPARA